MKMKPTPRPPAPRHAPRRIPPRRTLQARAATSREEIDDYDGEAEPNMKLSHAFMVVLVLHLLAVGGVFAFNSLKSPSTGRDRSTAKPAAEQPAPEVVSTAAAAAPAKPATPATTGASHTVAAGDTLTRIASKHGVSVEQLEKANGLTAGATIRVGQVLQLPDAPAAGTAEAPKPALVPTTKPAAPEPAKPVVAKAPEPPATKAPVATPKTTEVKPAPAATAAPKDAAPASGTTYVVAKGDNPYSIAKKLKVSYNELIKANKIEDPTKLQIGQKLVVP